MNYKNNEDEIALNKTYYKGWSMVTISVIGLSLSLGPLVVFTFGSFAKQLGISFLSNRGSISLLITVLNISVAIFSPLTGRLIDILGARKIILISLTGISCCLFSLYFVKPPLWHLMLIFAVAGMFGTGSHPVPFSRAVANWFNRRRGLALGITGIGLGLGGLFFPLLSQYLIGKVGWRETYLILGFICLLIAVPIIFFFFKNKPEDVGLRVDGFKNNIQEVALPSNNITIKNVFRTRTFWSLCIIFLLVAACGIGTLIHLQQMLMDRGITPINAAFAASLFAAASIIGRIIIGILIDKFFAPFIAAASLMGAVVGLIILWTGTGGYFIYLGAGLVGFALGAEADLMPFLLSKYFGINNLGTLCGIAFGAHTIGSAFGPYLFGGLFDITGSYRAPLGYACIIMFIAVILTFTLKKYDGPKSIN